MKELAKFVFKCVVFVCVVWIGFYAVIFTFYTNTSRWKYNVDDFQKNENDFDVVKSFCEEYINHAVQKDEDQCNYLTYSKHSLYYHDELVKLDQEVQNSLDRISNAFKHKDAKLDQIICYDDAVFFTTHNGLYSLVYSKKSLRDANADFYSKHISDGWYHVVKKDY